MPRGTSQFTLNGFIRVTLTDKQKEAAKKSDPFEGFDAFAEELLVAGYKLSVAHDAERSCYYATLTMTREGQSHSGFALSGRGPSVRGALQMLFYKHYTVLHGNWAEASGLEGDGWG
jgi:hypothetical protein